MIKIVVVLLLFAFLTIWDVPELKRNKLKKEIVVYFVLMFTGFILSLLAVFHVTI